MMASPAATDSGDQHWMRCALALARQGIGLASPNPTVGCVLVRDGTIVGEGFHRYDSRDHAEIVALKEARGDAVGATAYVTLEPCSHYGRTGPCARALLNAGIVRVVAATADPNPAVAGSGLALLRENSVHVDVGLCQAEARVLNDAFAHFIRTRTPLVTLKIAATLDGFIAPSPASHPRRASHPITGAAAHARVQSMRHAHDAILTGIGTILADDPLLTDRSGRPRRRPLLRVVLDSGLRLPLDARILSDVDNDLLVITRSEDAGRREALESRGARVLHLEAQQEGGISLRQVLHHLGEQEITSLMIEGGSRLNRGAFAADVIDKLALFTAPHFLGPGAVPMIAGDTPPSLPRLLHSTVERIEEDVLLCGYIHDPWAAQ